MSGAASVPVPPMGHAAGAAEARPDRGMDWLNLLLAASSAAYGAFVPVFLTRQAWTQTQIGLALTVGTIASVVSAVPGGLLVDLVGRRRYRLLLVGVIATGLVPLILALFPRPLPVLLSMILQALAGSILGPAIAATSLALVGHDALGERLGRNSRYGSIGAGVGAGIMGVCATWGGSRAVLPIAAALIIPALFALSRIGPGHANEIAHAEEEKRAGLLAPFAMLGDRRVLIFALSLALFQVASIAVVQLAAVEATARIGARAGLAIAAFVIVPQLVAAWLSPAIGRYAQTHGRRLVLLVGFATVPLRGALFALIRNPYVLMPVQVLEGIGGGTLAVMMPLVAADLTRRTGYYTLCISLLGLAGGVGTAISTALAGWVADLGGRIAAYWVLTAAGLAMVALIAFAMPETAPRRIRQAGRHAS